MDDQSLPSITPIEKRYYDAAVNVAHEQIDAMYTYITDDGESIAEIASLISGLQLYTTINHDSASAIWVTYVRQNDVVFNFVQRGASRAMFLASVTPSDWQYLCAQLAFAIHPGKRRLGEDAEVAAFLSWNKSELSEPKDHEPSVDATIVKRTDLTATYNTLLNNQWLVWLYVISMASFKVLGFKPAKNVSRRVNSSGPKPTN